MKKCLILMALFFIVEFSTLHTISYAASPSFKENVCFWKDNIQINNGKRVLFQQKVVQKRALPRPKNTQRLIPAQKHWHWATGLAVLLSLAFVACLYSLILGIPSLLFWIGIFTTPFLAYLFAWIAYKKCENAPERFNGNQFNWFIIAIVTGVIYALMVLTTVLVPLLFILSLVYGGGMYMPDLFGLWSMWDNPPKIPPFPKRVRN